MRLHQFGICEVSDGHLGVFLVFGCLWHRSPMEWVLNRHKNILLQLLHCSAWHLILSGAIKQAHLSAVGSFLGDLRPGEWFAQWTALYSDVELGIWSQFGRRTFQIMLLSLSCSYAVIQSRPWCPSKGGCAVPGNALTGCHQKHQQDLLFWTLGSRSIRRLKILLKLG